MLDDTGEVCTESYVIALRGFAVDPPRPPQTHTHASNGGFRRWWWRSRRLEYCPARCRHLPVAFLKTPQRL
jgi:hypothetical protein